MAKFLITVYYRQVIDECNFSLEAVKRMNYLLQNPDANGFFREARNLVHHASAISRIFWPPGNHFDKERDNKAKERGKTLRNAIDLEDDHIIKNRSLRDHFAHSDERLDEWAEKSKKKYGE